MLTAPTTSGTPAAAHTSTMASAPARVGAMGFSVITPRAPCSTAARVASGRSAACEEMPTMSRRSRGDHLPVVVVEGSARIALAERLAARVGDLTSSDKFRRRMQQ